MGGHHDHHHQGSNNLKVAFLLNVSFTIVEFVGGVFVNSVAIMSDAVHDLGDSLSLGMAWYLERKSTQNPDKKYSFGYHRFSLLGALINSIVLLVGSAFVIQEAIFRIIEPETSNALGMMYFAIAGVIVNGFAAWKMSTGTSLNEKVVKWHLMEDVLGWVAVLIVSIVLQFKDIPLLDPILSLGITTYILWGVIKRLIETMKVFLQGVPDGISIDELKLKFQKIEGVCSVHEMHIWSLEGDHHVFSVHVRLENNYSAEVAARVKQEIKEILSEYDFHHITIQVESVDEPCSFEHQHDH